MKKIFSLLSIACLMLVLSTKSQSPFFVKDINTLNTFSFPDVGVWMGSDYYFGVTDAASGMELWSSDGTLAGTTLVKDINPDISGFYPSSL